MAISGSSFIRKAYVILLSLLFFLSFTSVFPVIYSAPVCLLLLLVSFYMYGGKFPRSRSLVCIIAFMCISFFYVSIGRGSFVSFRNVAYLYMLLLTLYMASPAIRILEKEEIRFLWLACLGTVIFSIVMTFIIGRLFPNIVRIIGFTGSDPLVQSIAQRYHRVGLLSYESSNGLATVIALFTLFALESNKFWLRCIYAALALLAIYDCFSMTITTTFLGSVICVCIMLAVHYSRGKIKRFMLFLIIGIIVLSSSSILVNSLSRLSGDGSSQMAFKINDIIESMETGVSTGQMASRGSLYAQSFDAMLRHPFIGGAKLDEPGQHSCLLDMFAYYGVFALLLFVGWWHELKQSKQYLPPLQWYEALVCLFGSVLIVCLKGHVFLATLSIVTLVFWQIGLQYYCNYQNQLFIRQ